MKPRKGAYFLKCRKENGFPHNTAKSEKESPTSQKINSTTPQLPAKKPHKPKKTRTFTLHPHCRRPITRPHPRFKKTAPLTFILLGFITIIIVATQIAQFTLSTIYVYDIARFEPTVSSIQMIPLSNTVVTVFSLHKRDI